MLKPPQTFIFTGRSGCGKGTQSKLLMDYVKKIDSRPVLYIQTGNHFRNLINSNSRTSNLAREVSERGERHPDFLAVWIWSSLFVEKFTGKEHIIVDGAPRSALEAEMLHTAFNFYNIKPTIIYLNVTREWSAKRMRNRGRSDDADLGKINSRLDWFEKDVIHAVDFFKKNKEYYNFIEIKGERPIKVVHQEVISKVFSK